jgi:hypothetical protein
MGQFLKKFGEVQIEISSKGIDPSAPQTEERVEVEERDLVHSLPCINTTLYITPSMLRMDEIMGRHP